MIETVLLLAMPGGPLLAFALLLTPAWDSADRRAAPVAMAGAATGAAACAALWWRCAGGCAAVRAPLGPHVDFGGPALAPALGFDALSRVAAATVLAVGLAVLFYAARFMAGQPEQARRRLFAFLSLFLAGMLVVTLATDAVILFLGWEVIGLCSFFLIGFDGPERASSIAAQKAFVVTRLADALMAAGFILMVADAGSLMLDGMAASGAGIGAVLVVLGAMGKSAQVPFHVWLPDAMAGPVPVSALLHSATMVAAGVYLLARLEPALQATPGLGGAVAVAGLGSALFAGLAALAQRDVKRLLAFSTVSQIGYMVAAVGAGAPGAAMAHFAIHAAFKALLFLSAGVLADAAGSRDLGSLCGSLTRAPVAGLGFLVGAAALAGLPFATAGWTSKEALVAPLAAMPVTGPVLLALALIGAAVTAAYALRPALKVLTPDRETDGGTGGEAPRGPLIALPILALAGVTLAGAPLAHALLAMLGGGQHASLPLWLAVTPAALGTAAALLRRPLAARLPAHWRDSAAAAFRVDDLYEARLVQPVRRAIRAGARDPVAAGVDAVAATLPGPLRPSGTRAIRDRLAEAVDAVFVALSSAIARTLAPDAIARAVSASGPALLRQLDRARALQSGRVRDHALAAGLGLAALVIAAWIIGVA